MKAEQVPAAIISIIVLTMFGSAGWLLFFRTVPVANEDVLKDMFNALKVLTTGVVYYWTGSTQSGARKDETIAAQSKMLAQSTPTGEP
jgi:hypothetical protein